MNWIENSKNFIIIPSAVISVGVTVSSLSVSGDIVSSPTVEQDLVLNAIGNPNNYLEQFDPHAIFEAIAILDQTSGQQNLLLAKDVSASDGHKVWTLSLNEKALWSDGEVLDAGDVVFTANMNLEQTRLSWPSAVRFRSEVESVSKIDDWTVEFKLRKPNARFSHHVLAARREGIFTILPEHIWQGEDPLTFKPSPPIGSRPYNFKSSTEDELVLVRNDNWWGATTGNFILPEPKQLVWKKSETKTEAIEKLVNNELDVGPELTFDEWTQAKSQNPNLIVWNQAGTVSWPGPCGRQLDFNTKHRIWNKSILRKAIAAFINRQEVIDKVYKGSTSISATLFPAYGALAPIIQAIENDGRGFSPDADPLNGNALLTSAGFAKGADGIYEKDGEDLKLEIHVSTASDEYIETVDLIVQQLSEAGIAASAKQVDKSVFWARILPRGEFEMAYGWLSCGSVVDPYASLKRYHVKHAVPIGHRSPGFKNIARWDSEEARAFSEKVDEIEKLKPGDPSIVDLTVEAYRHIMDDMPFIPLVQEARIIPFNTSKWKGWPTADNPYAGPMYQWGQFHPILQNLEKAN